MNTLTSSALDSGTDTNSVTLFLRLHKKLQRYWTLVCGIWKLRYLSLMCQRLDDDIFVTFLVILKKRNLKKTKMTFLRHRGAEGVNCRQNTCYWITDKLVKHMVEWVHGKPISSTDDSSLSIFIKEYHYCL